MKTIYRIGRLELSLFFYSPIAWLVMVIFAIQTGMTFINDRFTEVLYSIAESDNGVKYVTNEIFTNSTNGLFVTVEKSLYLFIPLLTMGLISRELSSGSIKLLFSSPIKLRNIVLGKFLAIMCYWLVMLLPLFLVVVIADRTIESLDHNLLLTNVLGIFLLACVYSSIGIFLSSLTGQQVVAAISTLVVLALLNYIGAIGMGRPVIQDITYFLDIKAHLENMHSGLVTSLDLGYFILMIVFFLGLTVLTLKAKVESKPFYIHTARFIVFSCILLIMGFIVSRPTLTIYTDVTNDQSNTLAPASQQVLEKIKGPVQVTAFGNLLSDKIESLNDPIASGNSNIAAWERYKRYIPDIKLKTVLFYDTIPGSMFSQLGVPIEKQFMQRINILGIQEKISANAYLSPTQFHKIIDLSKYGNRSIYLLEYQNRKVFLRNNLPTDLINGADAESAVAAAFKQLIDPHPTIGVVTGHNERSITDKGDDSYKQLFNTYYENSLVEKGFDVTSLNLNQPVPGNINILVIADPTKAYTANELGYLHQFIAGGGNLLVTGTNQSVLNPIVDQLGVQFMDGKLVQQGQNGSPDQIAAGFTPASKKYSDEFSTFLDLKKTVMMQGAGALGYKNNGVFQVDPLLVTDAKTTWNKQGDFKLDTGKLNYDPKAGDTCGALPVVLALSRKLVNNKEQRIAIVDNADFITDKTLMRYRDDGTNFGFAVQLFKWFSYGEYPVEITRPQVINKVLINFNQLRVIKVLLVGLLPGLMMLGGCLFLYARKRI